MCAPVYAAASSSLMRFLRAAISLEAVCFLADPTQGRGESTRDSEDPCHSPQRHHPPSYPAPQRGRGPQSPASKWIPPHSCPRGTAAPTSGSWRLRLVSARDTQRADGMSRGETCTLSHTITPSHYHTHTHTLSHTPPLKLTQSHPRPPLTERVLQEMGQLRVAVRDVLLFGAQGMNHIAQTGERLVNVLGLGKSGSVLVGARLGRTLRSCQINQVELARGLDPRAEVRARHVNDQNGVRARRLLTPGEGTAQQRRP